MTARQDPRVSRRRRPFLQQPTRIANGFGHRDLISKGKSTLIGDPPPAVAAELEKLWKKQFRSQPK